MNNKLYDSVDNYLNVYTDVVNNFPPDGQRQRSRYYEVDCRHTHIINELTTLCKKTDEVSSPNEKTIKDMLMESLDLADRKLSITEHLMTTVNKNIHKLDTSLKDVKMARDCQSKPYERPKRTFKLRSDAYSTDDSSSNMSNLKQQPNINKTLNKSAQMKTNLNKKFHTEETIIADTNKIEKNNTEPSTSKTQCSESKISESSNTEKDVEPTYCICEEVSYGDMVCCDNDLCPIEWFHFGCISLTRKPRGKWYCPKCRGVNSKTMKPRKIFLKELEKYNKQKEEHF